MRPVWTLLLPCNHPHVFFVSVADKELSVSVSGLESTLTGECVSVDNKRVKRSENPEALAASAGEEAPEREGRMDLSAGQPLAEVLAARRMVQPVEGFGLREWDESCLWPMRGD